MKKLFIAAAVATVMIACGAKQSQEVVTTSDSIVAEDTVVVDTVAVADGTVSE